jgi:glycosyltransferase involved in cell wall biosynthesis
MHVAIDARLVYYTRAGIGEYTLRLTRALAEAYPGDRITLLQDFRDGSPLVTASNVSILKSRVPSHHRLEQYFLPLVVNGLKTDVFHSPDFIPPLKAKGPLVITIHDLAFLIYPQFVTKDSAHYYGQIDRAVRRADAIIAVSESTRHDLIKMLGAPDDKITVIYEAADPRFCPQPVEIVADVRARYGLPDRYLLFVGTIEPRKNLGRILTAFERLHAAGLTDALVIVGKRGWLYDDFFTRVEGSPAKQAVIFPGFIPDADLPAVYAGSQALAFPSEFEGFGLPVLEAMACGTPVVCSNTSSLPEVAHDAAFLIDPLDVDALTDALRRVLSDPALAADLRARGLTQAARFSWASAAESTLALYRRLAG